MRAEHKHCVGMNEHWVCAGSGLRCVSVLHCHLLIYTNIHLEEQDFVEEEEEELY